MSNNDFTPIEDGFRMPGRFEPHAASYVQWPTLGSGGYRWSLEGARRDHAETIKAIAQFEKAIIIVAPEDRQSLDDYIDLSGNLAGSIDVMEIPLDDAWVRDSGQIFVKNDEGEVAMVQFQFNGWGGKYPCQKDMHVARKIAENLGMRCYEAPFICEGGGISVDGEGTLITTEQVMRNSNRYTGWSREALEKGLHDYLGIEKVIWLELGLVEDLTTDGHVDNNVEFIAPGKVMLQMVPQGNPNYQICQDHKKILENTTDAKGRKLEVIEVHMLPYTDEVHGGPHPVPYVNGYVINDAFICPMIGSEYDEQAKAFLSKIYPDREIIGVPSAAISRDGGSIGCITQQQPVGSYAKP